MQLTLNLWVGAKRFHDVSTHACLYRIPKLHAKNVLKTFLGKLLRPQVYAIQVCYKIPPVCKFMGLRQDPIALWRPAKAETVSCCQWLADYGCEEQVGIEKICTNSQKKMEIGEEVPMPPHCARSASDPRTRPFFPLSANKALRTTALVLVSQGFGCPTVVHAPGSFQLQASDDVKENCLTPQLSSAVVRLVLEV